MYFQMQSECRIFIVKRSFKRLPACWVLKWRYREICNRGVMFRYKINHDDIYLNHFCFYCCVTTGLFVHWQHFIFYCQLALQCQHFVFALISFFNVKTVRLMNLLGIVIYELFRIRSKSESEDWDKKLIRMQ